MLSVRFADLEGRKSIHILKKTLDWFRPDIFQLLVE